MSVLNLLLWSTTPLLGLAALIGISRFERYVLHDEAEGPKAIGPEIVDTAVGPTEIAQAIPAQRGTQTTRTAA